jgi:hypothetical protein
MKLLTKASLLVSVSLLAACAAPSDPTPEEAEGTTDHAEAPLTISRANAGILSPILVGGGVLDPTPDVWQARITSDELYSSLLFLLGGSRLVIDTTKKSPSIPSEPFYHCWYPNQEARQVAQAECMAMAGSARMQCLALMNEELPNIKECSMTTGPMHSYIDFGPLAESYGAKDHTFDIAPIERDTWGPGGITVDINYVQTTIGPGTIAAEWTSEAGLPTASLTLDLASNNPTLPCVHWTAYLGCPDVELSNMKVKAKLTGIAPTPDKTQLGFGSVAAAFTFDRNLNNIPDSFLTVFVDVDKIIRNNVQKNVKNGLEKEASRTALNKALTALAEQSAKKNHTTWNGIKSFEGAWIDPATGALVFRYIPN